MNWKKISKKLFFSFVFLGIFILFSPAKANAAGTLYLTPASGSYAVGTTFIVSVHVNTGGETVNAVSAYINYPSNLLDVSWVGGTSFMTIWAEKTGGGGLVKLSGGVLPPGFTGNGLVGSVGFKVKKTGSATLSIASGSHVVTQSGNSDILALGSSGGATFTLVNALPTVPQATATLAPVFLINNVKAVLTDAKTAEITWDTTVDSDSLVEYGIQSHKYIMSSYRSEQVKSHKMTLTGLAAGTNFYYRVTSKDSQGNVKSSNEYKFNTPKAFDLSPTPGKKPKINIPTKVLPYAAGGIVVVLFGYFFLNKLIIKLRRDQMEKMTTSSNQNLQAEAKSSEDDMLIFKK